MIVVVSPAILWGFPSCVITSLLEGCRASKMAKGKEGRNPRAKKEDVFV